MNIHDLMQANGLKTFLLQYHKLLSDHYRFPPLTGMKPMHRAADVFNLPSGEALQGLWSQISITSARSSSTQETSILLPPASATDRSEHAHQQWLRAMSQGDYAAAVKTMGQYWVKHPDSILSAVRLGIAFRRNRQKNDASNLFLQALQLVESWQPTTFSWGTVAWSVDSDVVFTLGVATLSLAGMHLENGQRQLAQMYLERWIGPCERASSLPPRFARLYAWSLHLLTQCGVLCDQPTARMQAAQSWVLPLEQAAISLDFGLGHSTPDETGTSVAHDFGMLRIQTGPAPFDLRALRPFHRIWRESSYPHQIKHLPAYQKIHVALARHATFIGDQLDIQHLLQVMPEIKDALLNNASVREITGS